MYPVRLVSILTAFAFSRVAAAPQLPGIGAAMQEKINEREIAGAVTMVIAKDKILHQESTGYADIAAKRPIAPDSMFWIASMTKPITGVAVLMLQDEGKLNVSDPVAKYIPEFGSPRISRSRIFSPTRRGWVKRPDPPRIAPARSRSSCRC